MSSSNDVFEPEDFDNLIAAVDSLEIPLDDETSASPTTAKAANNSAADTVSNQQPFKAPDKPFENQAAPLALEPVEKESEDLYDMSAEFSELDFDEETNNVAPFASSVDFATSPGSEESRAAQFTVDDPFTGQPVQEANQNGSDDAITNEEDELFDVYASFLEETEGEGQTKPSSNNVDLFGDDGFEEFDGVAAANEISNLWMEDEKDSKQKPATNVTPAAKAEPQASQPLMSTMAKTQEAANKLKAHLASISTDKKQITESPAPEPITEKPAVNTETTNEDLYNGFEEFKDDSQALDQSNPATTLVSLEEESQDEFEGLFEDISEQSLEPVALNETKPETSSPENVSLPVGDLAEEPVVLCRKTENVSDNLMAAFLESSLSSNKKSRAISLQSIARKFPRIYLACTAFLAMLGFVYILAIPALLVVSLFNGFEMLNSPFTNNMALLLSGIFGISLFLFMAGYKLLDLKFIGPGGITLNHENANALIDKIQTLKKEQKIPKVHEIVLTRRHELNLIKIPRFGLPFWSKNVLAIGYPLLQTLPPEYFDVALKRRLTQYNKHKNMLHNWLSFMRRTWTIYAVSLKERKGVIDLLHYCFFAPYASLYRKFAVYVSQRDELLADEKALHCCNDRDLIKTAQTLRITRAMLIQYFWPKLNEELHSNNAAPHYIKPYSQLPGILKTLLETRQVDSWFIRLGQEETNPGDPEAPFAQRMATLGQRKVALPDSFEVNAAQHYFDDQYEKMTDLLDTLWAEELQKELFHDNIHSGNLIDADLPCHLAIEPA